MNKKYLSKLGYFRYLHLVCKRTAHHMKKYIDSNFEKDLYSPVGIGKDGTPTSLLDREAENFLFNEISQTPFHKFNILSEESGIFDNNSEYTLVIDPIDGTRQLSSHVPTATISIGLVRNGSKSIKDSSTEDSEEAIIYNYSTDDFWYAKKNEGAYYNYHPIKANSNIKKIQQNKEIICDTASWYRGIDINNIKIFSDTWSPCSYILGRLALGKSDFWYGSGCSWFMGVYDVCAGMLILKEAGGEVLMFNMEKKNSQKNSILKNFPYKKFQPDFFKKSKFFLTMDHNVQILAYSNKDVLNIIKQKI